MKKFVLLSVGMFFALASRAGWVYDPGAKTITDGTWVLNVNVVDDGLQLGDGSNGGAINSGNAGSGDLDLREVYADTGYRVVSIRDNAFKGVSVVSSLVAPDVVQIKANAFYSCKLTNIVVSADISAVGNFAFCSSKLQDITPRTFKIAAVPGSMFESCSSLQGDLSFPDATVVSAGAFKSTSAIGTIQFSERVTTIDTEAFRGSAVANILPLYMPNLVTLGDNCFYGAANLVGDFVWPKVTSIRGFRSARKVTSVVATNALIVGSACFRDCSALTNVQYSANATNIMGNCFYGCGNLESVGAYLPDTLQAFGGGFYSCSKLAMKLRIASPYITNLPGECFRGSASAFVGDVDIYSPLTTIGARAFQSSKAGQVYNFYAKSAPANVDFTAFNASGGNGGGRLGAYLKVYCQSALAGWQALCAITDESELASLPGYPGDKAVGAVNSSGYYHWVIDCTPPSGTLITVM